MLSELSSILKDAMYAARQNFEFCNMLLVAKYAPRKNLEKTHIHKICTKSGSKFPKKSSLIWQIWDYLPWRTTFCESPLQSQVVF